LNKLATCKKVINCLPEMKNLILIRHATAESENFLKKDFGRTLEAMGRTEAEKVGAFIKSKGTNPDKIVTSSALRTLETAQLASVIIGFKPAEIITSLQLYNAGFQKLIEEIKKTETTVQTLIIVAHNPGISQTATALAQTGNFQLATSAAVSLTFKIDNWAEIKPASGTENWYYFP